MNCIEAESKIQAFIDDKLSGEPLDEYITHIRGCHSCYEEMETSYLLKEALARIENGETLNLHRELMSKIDITNSCYNLHKVLTAVRRMVMIISVIIVVFDSLYLYFTFL